MRTQLNKLRQHLGGGRKLLVLAGVLAIAGVVTVLAIQDAFSRRTAATGNHDSSRPMSYRNVVTLDRVGHPIVLDRQTGAIRVLDQDEKIRLAEGLKQVINNTTDGLVEVRREDGSVSMDLDGHFQDVMLARREADGTVSESCVSDLEAAANFFQIDPQLLGLSNISPRNSTSTTPRVAER